MTPFFSIIIPCYNVATFIEQCLRSVLDQPFQDWECLAVVETSRDQTEQIVRSFAEKDPRIRVFTLPRSGSPSTPRNTGLDHAEGKYVIFLDGDDYIFENSLEKIAAKITACPNADLYPCAIFVQDAQKENSNIRDNYRLEDPSEMTGPESILINRYRIDEPCPMAQMTVCRRMFLEENRLRFIPGLKYEDGEFHPRAFYRAKKVVPLHEVFYFYRMNPQSITGEKNRNSHFLPHHANKMRRRFAFHATVSKEKGYDFRISECWANQWLSELYGRWFFPGRIKNVPRTVRIATLRSMFADGPDNFQLLVRFAPLPKRLMSHAILLAVRHPSKCAALSDLLFRIFFFLSEIKKTGFSKKQSRSGSSNAPSVATSASDGHNNEEKQDCL